MLRSIDTPLATARDFEAKGDFPAAVRILAELLNAHPGDREVLLALSRLSTKLGARDDALTLFDLAMASAAADAGSQLDRAALLEQAGRRDDALASLRALAGPDDPAPQLRLGYVYRRGLDYEAARRNDLALAAAHPAFAAGWISLGIDFHTTGDLAAADACFRRALAVEPGNPFAHFSRGTSLLAAGLWRQGFAEFAWRRKFPDAVPAPGFLPEWRGGRSVLLWNDQGLGDAIQFLRFVPQVRARGVETVLLLPDSLVRLACSVPKIGPVLSPGEALPSVDGHLPLMDVPDRFGLEEISAGTPYVRPDSEAVEAWRRRFAPLGGLKVGLVRAGASRAADFQMSGLDHRRSIPAADLAPLLAVAGASFFNLQPEASWEGIPESLRPVDAMTEIADFAGTAALMEALDLVITVDTAVAHLAGALGKPVWILSRYDGCWRWLKDRTDSPWYPTVRLFRQAVPGDWGPVIGAVAAALGGEVGARL